MDSNEELKNMRHYLESDGMAFMRYFFYHREDVKLKLTWHQFVIDYVLQAVLDGKISRLIINIAPGYLKTEIAVINFISRGLAINPRSKFIHTSYSDMLVGENSLKIKDTIELPEFQELWPMEIRRDKGAKNLWFNKQGGGLRCAPAQGQITGFRAGRMEPGFSGALIQDDALKPDDAYSFTVRTKVNNRSNNTLRSRLGLETTPIINIMQSLHEDDLTQFLLCGGSGDMWHHLEIPTRLDEDLINHVEEKHTHKIKIDINGVLSALNGHGEYEF